MHKHHPPVPGVYACCWCCCDALMRPCRCTDYTLTEYEALGHSASIEEIADVLRWLQGVLPPLR